MTTDAFDESMEILERMEDIVRLYPEGAVEPMYAGRIVWRDWGNLDVENFGDVEITAHGVRLRAAVWTGKWSSEGNPLLTWVDPPFEFASIDALRAWLAGADPAVEPESTPAGADVGAPARAYVERTDAEVTARDVAYVDPPVAEVSGVAREYIEAPPSEIGTGSREFVPPVSEV